MDTTQVLPVTTEAPVDPGEAIKLIAGAVPARPVRSDLVSAVEVLIVGRTLPPDTKLPSERDLASVLGIARSVAREALRSLIDAHLLEVRPGRGTYVRHRAPLDSAVALDRVMRRQQPTPRNLIEARRAIESESAQRAAERAEARDLAVIETAVIHLEQSVVLLDQVRYDLAFHFALARASGNPIIEIFLTSVAGMLGEMMFRSLVVGSDETASQVRLHRVILDHVRNRDPRGAANAMCKHLSNDYLLGDAADKRVDPLSLRALGTLISGDMLLESLLDIRLPDGES